MKPIVVARFDERPRILELPDGTLLAVHVTSGPEVQSVEGRYSKDEGKNWTERQTLFPLPAEPKRWGGTEGLVDRDGEIHFFMLNDRGTGVFRDPSDEGRVRPLDVLDRRLDIWHARTEGGRERWQEPKRIWEGYTGSINCVTQTAQGKIILPFAYLTPRTWDDRGEGLDAFWYAGQNSSTVIYSDDGGDTWTLSPSELKVQTPSIGRYGAVEPVVLQLRDGHVWMLMRTQVGRLYESFSDDGSTWSEPRPTDLISSDSPAGIVRLPDGRMVLLWNACLRFPYALGGRHVLHAAVSEDDGRTWIGHREVARDPLRHEPPPPRGDHGTAYPYPTALESGKVIMTTGQGKGRIAIVRVDPQWLYETTQETSFEEGLEEWSVFGCKGVELVDHPERKAAKVLAIAKTAVDWPAAAVWNFPFGVRGTLTTRMCVQPGSKGAFMLLSDHYSVPFDPEDMIWAAYRIEITPEGGMMASAGAYSASADRSGGQGPSPGSGALVMGRWHTVQLSWDCAARTCEVSVDGEPVLNTPLRHEAKGVCYLRLRSAAETAEDRGLLVDFVKVEVERPSG